MSDDEGYGIPKGCNDDDKLYCQMFGNHILHDLNHHYSFKLFFHFFTQKIGKVLDFVQIV
jgi:hypothetical protein